MEESKEPKIEDKKTPVKPTMPKLNLGKITETFAPVAAQRKVTEVND